MDFYRFLFFFIFFICCYTVPAQKQPAPETFDQRLRDAKSTTEKAELFFEIGDQISINDTLSAVSNVRKGLALVKPNTYYEGIGYFYLGRIYMDFSTAKAETAFDTALYFFQQVTSPESYVYQSRAWANKALIAQLNGDNKTYINLFLEEAIPLAAKGGDSLRVADDYTSIALPFMNYGEYEKAILYLNKSEALFKRLAPNDLRLVDVYCHLAKVYLLQDQITVAGQNLQNAASILKQNPNSLYAPNFHAIESMYLIKLKLWNEAEKTIERGLAIAEKLKNRYEIRQLLYQKAALYDAQQNWKASKEVLIKMYEQGYVELITDKQQLFGDLARLENNLGNYKQAYDWMLKHEAASDEIYNQETKAKIADLEARYNFVQKEKELLLANAKSERQKQTTLLVILSSVIVLIALYFWYRTRRVRAVQRLKQQQQMELGKALLEGEERERSRLARDLHDGLGGMLAGIKLNLSQMIKVNETLNREQLTQTVDRLGYSVNELRRISRNMMPESLLQSGLEIALKDLCEEAPLPGMKITFKTFDLKEHFSPQVKVMIYRIVQELIYNVVKHAEASKVMVQCILSENVFFITVEDNGKGFSTANIPATSSGLKNIRSRVSVLNGKMDIESSEDGTIINIELYVGE